jgi:hypothetical protein
VQHNSFVSANPPKVLVANTHLLSKLQDYNVINSTVKGSHRSKFVHFVQVHELPKLQFVTHKSLVLTVWKQYYQPINELSRQTEK